MRRFVCGVNRNQRTLCPECLDKWINRGNPVCVSNALVDALDPGELGFDGVGPCRTTTASFD